MDGHGSDGSAAAQAFDTGTNPCVVCEGPGLRIVAANASARRSWLADTAEESSLRLLFATLRTEELFTACDTVLRTGVAAAVRDQRLRLDLGGTGARDAHFDCEVVPWLDAHGDARGVIIQGVDVTAATQRRLVAEIESAAASHRRDPTRQALVAIQDALLPSGVPVVPGLDLAARYVLTDAEDGCGGDWFDAFVLESGETVLVVGDVPRREVGATALMGRLSAVLAERLRSGCGLAESLAAVDAFAAHLPGACATSVAVAVIDAASGRVRYCTAGHPAPLLVTHDGRAAYLPQTGSGALGMGSHFEELACDLPEGAVVLLFSNGAIDRPDPAAGRRQLGRDVARAVRQAPPSAGPHEAGVADVWCNQVLESISRVQGQYDDIVLLMAARVRVPADLSLSMPGALESLRPARAAFGQWLAGLHCGHSDEVALNHAVAELVTNAVEHAYSAGATDADCVDIDAHLDPAGWLTVSVTDVGVWREHAERGRGRGLATARDLVDDLVVERRADGTTVTVRARVTRPGLVFSSSVEVPEDVLGVDIAADDAAAPRVTLRGCIDLLDADEVRATLLARARGGTRDLVVDLSGLHHLSSAGVQVLAEVADVQHRGGHRLDLEAEPGSPAQLVLDTVGLAHL